MPPPPRYARPTPTKQRGATATPPALATALATAMIRGWTLPTDRPLRILDPAVGDGILVEALLDALRARTATGPRAPAPHITIFDLSGDALSRARSRLALRTGQLTARHEDFLAAETAPADLIIANPPWVRTQVLGAAVAQALAARHGLRGRIDLAHAFLVRISELLAPGGRAGIWVSNKLLSTRGASAARAALAPRLRAVWDLGDTRMFNAAVLPAAVFLGDPADGRPAAGDPADGKPADDKPVDSSSSHADSVHGDASGGGSGSARPAPAPPGPERGPPMLRVHRSQAERTGERPLLDLLGAATGPACLADGTPVEVERGRLATDGPAGPWRLETPESRAFLLHLDAHTGARLADLGPVRVGIKSTADAVFLRNDWEARANPLPELLRVASTHRSAHPLCPRHPEPAWRMLYPHRVALGKRVAVPLEEVPASAAWLHSHEERLRGRRYLSQSTRAWYELWVPHDPDAWAQPKLVWRDIAARPCMWVDLEGTVVNGDCYWLPAASADDPRLWAAAAVGCSSLALRWYDLRCGNRLYAGRRRFLAQYMVDLPLPRAPGRLAALATTARGLYEDMRTAPDRDFSGPLRDLDALVWSCFALPPPSEA